MWQMEQEEDKAMREILANINMTRTAFSATFVRYGIKPAYKGLPLRTLLFKNVMQGEKMVADHIWFTDTLGFRKLGELKEGDVVRFNARVRPYYKGYLGDGNEFQELDYKLSYPTRISRQGETR
jgi:hypothetical protein